MLWDAVLSAVLVGEVALHCMKRCVHLHLSLNMINAHLELQANE